MKLQFYAIKSVLFALLLLIGWGKAVNAQSITLNIENFTTGGDGTQASGGNVLMYTINFNSGSAINFYMFAYVPAGTAYVQGSSTIQGLAVNDIGGNMPFAYGYPVIQGVNFTATYKVKVTANLGSITNTAKIEAPNPPGIITFYSQTRNTSINADPTCGLIYRLGTSSSTGKRPVRPYTVLPYQYIMAFNPAQTVPLNNEIYGGATALCKNAYSDADLPAGSVLVEATALAQAPGRARLYFVNRPVNNAAPDLCYLELIPDANGAYTAKQYVGTPLSPYAADDISRMTFDGAGNGYALTEYGKLIHFTVNWVTNQPTIDAGVFLTDDASNPYSVGSERGGDICADGSGKLIFIPNSGHVYRIDPAAPGGPLATYLGTITGMPAAGCTAIATDNAGYLYMGGLNENVYKITPSTWTAVSFPSEGWATTDFASCMLPITQARTTTNENTVPAVQQQLTTAVSARVLPNPFIKELNVQVNLNTAEVVKVRLTDFYGRTVFTTTEKLGAGANSLRLTMPDGLGAGMYVLELWAGNNRLLQKKLLKQ